MTELKKQPYRKIVVPIDGSGWADRAIPHAARIAKNNDAELILLHIYHSPLAQYRDSVALAQQQGLVDQEREQIKQHIISIRTDLRNEGVTVRGHMIDGRDPAFQICRYVQAEGADLVVMCTHGRTGLARFLFGSVAQKVMQRLDVPVLLIRPDNPEETNVDDSDMPKGEDIV
ncbi:MAG: universal stress protein [Anaerolineales bacterium]|nr:universal stress protein [Anaerolineales bacterium]